jgi:hypothetical protein
MGGLLGLPGNGQLRKLTGEAAGKGDGRWKCDAHLIERTRLAATSHPSCVATFGSRALEGRDKAVNRRDFVVERMQRATDRTSLARA